MKATVLYCDRCAAEGRGNVLATVVVWVRTSLGGRTNRLDVCAEHLALIVGQGSPNGATPPAERVWNARAGEKKLETAYNRVRDFAAKHERFSLEDVLAFLGKDVGRSMAGRTLMLLVADGKLERYRQGIYQRPGVTVPAPASTELAAKLVQKLVTTRPGIASYAAAALCGIDRHALWQEVLASLRADKRIRSKGKKSAMRLYPT